MGDGQVVKWAVEFLEQRHPKPFLLAVGIFRPHLPFYAPRRHFERFPLAGVSPPIVPLADLDDIPPGRDGDSKLEASLLGKDHPVGPA